jgi:hypothetical protein
MGRLDDHGPVWTVLLRICKQPVRSLSPLVDCRDRFDVWRGAFRPRRRGVNQIDQLLVASPEIGASIGVGPKAESLVCISRNKLHRRV